MGLLRAMCNRLVHAYFSVAERLLWLSIRKDLPPLEFALVIKALTSSSRLFRVSRCPTTPGIRSNLVRFPVAYGMRKPPSGALILRVIRSMLSLARS